MTPVTRKHLAQPDLTNGFPSARRARGSTRLPLTEGGGGKMPQTPPPAPPIRGVTKKDTPTTREGEGSLGSEVSSKGEGQKDSTMEEEKKKKTKKEEEEGEYEEPDDQNTQVYDTPPTSRWQHTASPAVCVDESIYNTPRVHPANTEQGSEVYDVPTLPVTMVSDIQQQTSSIPACLAAGEEVEEDVSGAGLLYSVPGPAPRADGQVLPREGAEPDCGVYDMPAPSTSSGDVQWKGSLSALIQSALGTASLATPSPRELAASLAEILSVWRGSGWRRPAPPLLQAWSRLSDPLPALAACGPAPPSEALLSLVRRALEDSAALLQIQATPGRPRLPSQDSLSRRPLPALPVAETPP
ncbi:hypothetical protein COCON_G00113680 [Conger conger]|uniref:Uncharacterized protein n=1 Tax=Conger conger TaxID=82655 RepID=A0A9Q1DFT8_CONCO|nr:hypothetical protein COCON_G00113680 [Conger conger]